MMADWLSGTWEILACQAQSGSREKTGIEGTIFQLNNTGDVSWKVPGGAVILPLFSCETYEVVIKNNILEGALVRFGAYNGHVIEFKIEQVDPELMMVCERWCSLRCRRIVESKQDTPVESPFSLLPALEDGYFSDLTILASNNKAFSVHTCILKLSAPDLDWSTRPPPLSMLPEDILGTILHYLYSQCLPSCLEDNVAKQVVVAATDLPGLEPLVQICQLYLKNTALKQQIISLVSDMHSCAYQIIEYFSDKNFQYSENLASDPAKLCFAVKSSIREVAVIGSKLILLCDVYTKRKGELSREENHEIIRYAKSRLPLFMGQFSKFLQAVKSTFSNLLPTQRQEVACYLVPEIENILDTLASLLVKMKVSLEMILTQSQAETLRNSKTCVDDNLEKTIFNDFMRKEFSKLRCFHQKITCCLLHLQQKKQTFNEMTAGNKIRSVARDLEQIMEELPVFILRLEEVTGALDEGLEWRESKFCFKVGTSKVSGVLGKLHNHRDSLQEVMTQLCDLVQRDAFIQSVVTLGLLDPSQYGPAEHFKSNNSSKNTSKHHGYKLNLVESLCMPPPARLNKLSKAAIQLLKSGQGTDMVFEIVMPAEPDTVIDHTGTASAVETDPSNVPEISSIQAHRVIVAARCDWFRRALLSGMQEDIHRKIEVHNTSPYLFQLFLEYLYSGSLDYATLTVDHLAELLLLSDKYELDSLKQACEHGLTRQLDEESVLYLFSMADQFNASLLKTTCVQFINENPNVMDSEVFEELPDNLQTEIYDLVIWGKPQQMYLTNDKFSMEGASPNSLSSSLEEMTSNLHLNSHGRSDSSSLEDLPLAQDSARLGSVLEQVRDIVGPGPSRDELTQVILAADFDVNRAVNYYYSSS